MGSTTSSGYFNFISTVPFIPSRKKKMADIGRPSNFKVDPQKSARQVTRSKTIKLRSLNYQHNCTKEFSIEEYLNKRSQNKLRFS
jgi:hypothetical protein